MMSMSSTRKTMMLGCDGAVDETNETQRTLRRRMRRFMELIIGGIDMRWEIRGVRAWFCSPDSAPS